MSRKYTCFSFFPVSYTHLDVYKRQGFDKDVSIKLINSTLAANTDEDMFATLDIEILDLFNGNMEYIKSSACPTYVKRGRNVQLLKEFSLPAGILDDMGLTVYDYCLLYTSRCV